MWVKVYDSIFQEVCFLLQEMTIVHKEYGSFKPVKTALESRNIFLEIVDKMTVKGNNGKSDKVYNQCNFSFVVLRRVDLPLKCPNAPLSTKIVVFSMSILTRAIARVLTARGGEYSYFRAMSD